VEAEPTPPATARRAARPIGSVDPPEADSAAPPKPIRVLVVDDHDLFRVGLASMLGSHADLEVVAQASGGKMAVRLAAELRPDVILMDLRLPDLDGVAATKAILDGNPSLRIVVLTVIADETGIASAVSAGACGYLLKDSPLDDVAAAIRAAATGTAWLSPQVAKALIDRTRRTYTEPLSGANPEGRLSRRELEVLTLLASGLDNNEIASALSISTRTAKNHVSSILNKLEVNNRLQAAVYAVRRGLA
jgi:DNA-binding NarL/FixJ family response regulator